MTRKVVQLNWTWFYAPPDLLQSENVLDLTLVLYTHAEPSHFRSDIRQSTALSFDLTEENEITPVRFINPMYNSDTTNQLF